jgi:hypothetical protein
MEDDMEDFTFDDFVAVLGALDVSDPADVLEAWEDFQAGNFVEGVSHG